MNDTNVTISAAKTEPRIAQAMNLIIFITANGTLTDHLRDDDVTPANAKPNG